MKVLLIGKGISNNSCALLCKQLKIEYDYVDVNDYVSDDYLLIIKSPGVSYDSNIIKKFIKLGIVIITDIEFVYWFLNRYYIGVTGSNGKTTTTLLITNILNTKYNVVACGNIGYSISQAVLNNKECTHLVCELSSFQLKGTKLFTPNIAVITNINECHIDYHKTLKDYIECKKKILINQTTTDYTIYNLDCPNTVELVKDSSGIKLSYSITNTSADCYIKEDIIFYKGQKILKVSKIKEKNTHTLGNYLASIIVANIHNIKKHKYIRILKEFKPVLYRFEYIKKNIINDAKSTNVFSTIAALNSINKSTILLCGGYYRTNELYNLDDHISSIKMVVVYGETSNIVEEYFSSKNIICIKCPNLQTATKISLKYLTKKDTLLYSPMFASYDQFKSYKERGLLFNNIIKKIH